MVKRGQKESRVTQFRGKETLRLAAGLLVAGLCLAPSSALGQTNASPRSGRSLWTAQARRALDESIFHESVRSGIGGFNLTLDQSQNAKGLIFVNPGRAGTLNTRVGSYSFGTNGLLAQMSHHGAVRANATLPPAIGDSYTNGAGTGLWSNAGNWSVGLPGTGNDVFITGAGPAASVNQDIAASINNFTVN